MDIFNKLIYDVIVNNDVRFERLGRWLIGENLVVFDFYLIGKINEINMNRI